MSSSRSTYLKLLNSSYVKTILLAVILVGSVFAFWFGVRVALRSEYPLLTVASGSMIPTLNVGDLIVVQGILNYSNVSALPRPYGDIIVFRSPRTEDELIVHRTVNKTMYQGIWYFQTQGDANGGPDYWTGPDTMNAMISQNLIIGKVIGKVPYLGYIPLYIRTPVGLAFVIFLILLVIVIEYIPFSSKKPESRES